MEYSEGMWWIYTCYEKMSKTHSKVNKSSCKAVCVLWNCSYEEGKGNFILRVHISVWSLYTPKKIRNDTQEAL